MMNKISENTYDNFLVPLLREASEKIFSIEKKILSEKDNGTEFTLADSILNEIICDNLEKLSENIPIISEEKEVKKKDFLKKKYWLIDPLDGTKNYINGGDEYTINIALIENGEPVLGIIGHPPSGKIWYGEKNNAYLIEKDNKKKMLTQQIVIGVAQFC